MLNPRSILLFIFVLRESEPGGAPGLVFLQIPRGFLRTGYMDKTESDSRH